MALLVKKGVSLWIIEGSTNTPSRITMHYLTFRKAIERLHGKRLFSKFDIQWGYNNIRIAEEDQHKAAFKTPFGTFVPQVMYFGLTNAPPFFQ
jgi:hypothetical protein